MYRFHRQLVTGTYSINHPVCTRRKKCLCAQIQNIYLHIKYIWIPKNHSHPLSLTAKEDNEGYKLQYNVLFYKKNRDAQLPFCSIDQSVSRVAIYNPPFLPSLYRAFANHSGIQNCSTRTPKSDETTLRSPI